MMSGIQIHFQHKCVVKARKRGDNLSHYDKGQGDICSNISMPDSKSNKIFVLQCL